MRKKILLTSLTLLTSVTYALPYFTLEPNEIKSPDGKPVVVKITFHQDASDRPAAGFGLKIKEKDALPTGVTIDNFDSLRNPVTNVKLFPCERNKSEGQIVTGYILTKDDNTGKGALIKDGLSTCEFSVTAPSGTSGKIEFLIDSEEFSSPDAVLLAREDEPSRFKTANPLVLTIGGGTTQPTHRTTVNYSTETGTGSGDFRCDSGDPGTKVDNGTEVKCTAIPKGTDTVVITGCPVALTDGDKVCKFTTSSKDEDKTVTLSAKFDKKTPPPTTYKVTPGNVSVSMGRISCTGNSCTATPVAGYYVSDWRLDPATAGSTAACPVGSKTDTGAKKCSVSLTADATLTPYFALASSQNPGQTQPARPVPALGLFGLLAMLASMVGATTMVARRRK